MWGAARVKHAPIAEQRIEDPGQATGERNHGDGLAAPRGDVQGPRAEGLGLRGPAPEDGDGGLDQEPAHARGAGLGDVAAALGLA